MSESSTEKNLRQRVKDLEQKTIEQEHRIFSIVRNLIKFGVDEPDKHKFKSAISSFVSYILKRQTIIIALSILTGALSFVSLSIAYQSKNLLSDQNKKIELQNQLIEADRRSSLVFLFNNIMDELSKDIKDTVTAHKYKHINRPDLFYYKKIKTYPKYSKISKPLIARIISLSIRLKPYKEFNYTINNLDELKSPERGQLLNNLIESGLDDTALNYIFSKGTFEYAELNDLKYFNKNLDNLNLNHANLKNANFHNTSFGLSDFSYANLENANFINGSNLYLTNFSNANLKNAKFDKSILTFTNFSYANLINADFGLQTPYEYSTLFLNDAKLDSTILRTYIIPNDTDRTNENNIPLDSIARAKLYKQKLFHEPIFNDINAFSNNITDVRSRNYLKDNYRIKIIDEIFKMINANDSTVFSSNHIYRSILVKKN